MSAGQHVTTGSTTEMPSNSNTAEGSVAGTNTAPKDSVRDADLSNQESKIGQASTTANQSGSAEAAAEKLYAERIEDEYAKREGGA